MKPLSLIFMCFLLSGCVVTQMEWARPGVSAGQADIDGQACRAAAGREAFMQRSLNRSLFYPGYRYDPYTGRRLYPSPMAFGRDDPFIESRLFDFCMRSKGYSLIPMRGGEGEFIDP